MTPFISLPHTLALTLTAMSLQSRMGLAAQPLGVPTQSLQNECSITGVISDTSGVRFSPYKSNAGTRAPDIPASVNFEAKLNVETRSTGCADFQKKYLLGNTLDYPPVSLGKSVGLGLGLNQSVAEQIAQSAEGKTVTLVLSQYFSYQLKENLPFFPLFHSESWSLSGLVNLDVVGAALDFHVDRSGYVDTKKVYNVPAPSDLDDAAKLTALKIVVAISKQQALGRSYPANVFENLWLFELKPKSPAAKQEFAEGIFEFLNFKASEKYPNSSYFRFEVGGAGGAEFGDALAVLSKEKDVLTPAIKQKLVLNFPHLLKLGYGPKQGFEIDPLDLYTLLDTFLETDISELSQIQKWQFADLAKEILQKSGSAVSNHPELTSNTANKIATEILAKLKEGSL
jgi:hypothetical protein